MKKKEFLIGLGVGMVFASAITMVNPPHETLTDEEIKAEAMKLGMVEKEDALDQVLKQEGTAAPTSDATATVEASAAAETSAEKTPQQTERASSDVTAEPEDAMETVKKETKAPKSTPSAEKSKDTKKTSNSYVKVEIKAGTWSGEIAQKMSELALVDDAEEFDDFLCDNGYASMIRVGVYQIPKGSTYKEIAEIITK